MNHLDTFTAAVAAADKAELAHNPGQYVAVEHENPLDDNSPVKKVYEQPFELEGMAFVRVRGTSSFGRWLKKTPLTIRYRDRYSGIDQPRELRVRRDDYRGGVGFSAPFRGYERSTVWAQTFVATVNELDPKAGAFYDTYMD